MNDPILVVLFAAWFVGGVFIAAVCAGNARDAR